MLFATYETLFHIPFNWLGNAQTHTRLFVWRDTANTFSVCVCSRMYRIRTSKRRQTRKQIRMGTSFVWQNENRPENSVNVIFIICELFGIWKTMRNFFQFFFYQEISSRFVVQLCAFRMITLHKWITFQLMYLSQIDYFSFMWLVWIVISAWFLLQRSDKNTQCIAKDKIEGE